MSKFSVMNGAKIKALSFLTFNMLERAVDNLHGSMLSSIIACAIVNKRKKESPRDVIFLSSCEELPSCVLFKSCFGVDRTDYQSFQLRSSIIKDKSKIVQIELWDSHLTYYVVGVHLSRHANSKITGHYGTKILPSIVFEIVQV